VSDSAALQVRRLWRTIVLLLGCMAMLFVLKWQLNFMGQQRFLPSRLLLFAAISDSLCIGFLLWRIRRIEGGNDRRAAAPEASYISDLAKVLGGYAALDATICGVVFLTANISFGQAAWDFLLFLIPGLLIFPVIFRARQLVHRPKASALWFALAVGLFVPALAVAMAYSGFYRWLVVPMTDDETISTAVLGTVIAASSAYYSTYKSLSQRELANQAERPRGQTPGSA
jgi:hypothetical protein